MGVAKHLGCLQYLTLFSYWLSNVSRWIAVVVLQFLHEYAGYVLYQLLHKMTNYIYFKPLMYCLLFEPAEEHKALAKKVFLNNCITNWWRPILGNLIAAIVLLMNPTHYIYQFLRKHFCCFVLMKCFLFLFLSLMPVMVTAIA